MAYSSDNFYSMLIADGRHMHFYTTTDNEATTIGADYFLSEYERINVGDFILAIVDTGGTPAVVVLGVLTSAAGGLTVATLT